MSRLLAALLFALACYAQAADPKPKASDYPASGRAGEVEFGAENWGHGFVTLQGAYALDQYIAVEVAVYPARNKSVVISSGNFQLRLNRKSRLLAQAPGLVAASLKYPDLDHQPRIEGEAGMGDAGVILGRPRQTSRFPGDPRAQTNPLPPPPSPGDRPGMPQKQEKLTIDQILDRAALPSVEIGRPASGYLFFPYRGKMKSLKSIELLYEGPAGSASLTLR